MLIAAIALANDLTLISGNVGEFSRFLICKLKTGTNQRYGYCIEPTCFLRNQSPSAHQEHECRGGNNQTAKQHHEKAVTRSENGHSRQPLKRNQCGLAIPSWPFLPVKPQVENAG
jgi:hypothetical protein